MIAKDADERKILHQHGVSVAANNWRKGEEDAVDRSDSPVVDGQVVRTILSTLILLGQNAFLTCGRMEVAVYIEWVMVSPLVHRDGIESPGQ